MKKVFTYLLGIITPLIFVAPAFAQSAPPRIEEIGGIIDNVFKWVMPFGGLIALVMIIIGGYMWMTSGGDSSKTAQAQGTMTWAVIGLVFLFIFGMVLKGIFDFIGN